MDKFEQLKVIVDYKLAQADEELEDARKMKQMYIGKDDKDKIIMWENIRQNRLFAWSAINDIKESIRIIDAIINK